MFDPRKLLQNQLLFLQNMVFCALNLLQNSTFTAPKLLQNGIIPAPWAASKHSTSTPAHSSRESCTLFLPCTQQISWYVLHCMFLLWRCLHNPQCQLFYTSLPVYWAPKKPLAHHTGKPLSFFNLGATVCVYGNTSTEFLLRFIIFMGLFISLRQHSATAVKTTPG